MPDADSVIMTSALLTIGSTVGASILPDKYGGHGTLPSTRLLIGTALTFTGLGMLGDFQPAIAGPLALCIAFTAVTYYGLPLLTAYFSDPDNPNRNVGTADHPVTLASVMNLPALTRHPQR